MSKFIKTKFEDNNLKELTTEQIQLAKETFGKVYLVVVEDKKCYLHKPDRLTLDNADAQGKKRSSMFNEVLMKSTWLAGDKEIITNDDYFFGASRQLDEIITFKEGEIKEL